MCPRDNGQVGGAIEQSLTFLEELFCIAWRDEVSLLETEIYNVTDEDGW